jgi:hypothetical protein
MEIDWEINEIAHGRLCLWLLIIGIKLLIRIRLQELRRRIL